MTDWLPVPVTRTHRAGSHEGMNKAAAPPSCSLPGLTCCQRIIHHNTQI